jgi:hypothetical protein
MGVVGKDRRSVYEPGRRSRSWLKTKVPGAHLAHDWKGDASIDVHGRLHDDGWFRLLQRSRRCSGDENEIRACKNGSPSSIARKLAAIAVYDRSIDHPTPTAHDVVRAAVRGTRRQLKVFL